MPSSASSPSDVASVRRLIRTGALIAVAVAHEEMHPETPSQAYERDKRRKGDAGDQESSDRDSEADYQFGPCWE